MAPLIALVVVTLLARLAGTRGLAGGSFATWSVPAWGRGPVPHDRDRASSSACATISIKMVSTRLRQSGAVGDAHGRGEKSLVGRRGRHLAPGHASARRRRPCPAAAGPVPGERLRRAQSHTVRGLQLDAALSSARSSSWALPGRLLAVWGGLRWTTAAPPADARARPEPWRTTSSSASPPAPSAFLHRAPAGRRQVRAPGSRAHPQTPRSTTRARRATGKQRAGGHRADRPRLTLGVVGAEGGGGRTPLPAPGAPAFACCASSATSSPPRAATRNGWRKPASACATWSGWTSCWQRNQTFLTRDGRAPTTDSPEPGTAGGEPIERGDHMAKSNGNGVSVVLVHGGFVDGAGWEGVYRILKKDGYHVSIVQNPTHVAGRRRGRHQARPRAQDGAVLLSGIPMAAR